MASYPKRLDLWNVYLDKEIKAGDLRAARNLLERLVRGMRKTSSVAESRLQNIPARLYPSPFMSFFTKTYQYIHCTWTKLCTALNPYS